MLIGVVIVTYNRLQKLKKCLTSYEAQTHRPDRILVIDNASTDGTKEFLDQWVVGGDETGVKRMLLHCPENRGGAGGFSEGTRLMADSEVDWIWLSDDDAYPMPQCLERIVSFYETLPETKARETMTLCAKVVGPDGSVSPLHRRKIQYSRFFLKEIPLNESSLAFPIEIDLFSFVGVAIRKDIVRQAGLPDSSYFIYFDDSEYALRIRRFGKNWCIPEAVILHDSLENVIVRYSWKNYYMFRNKLYTYKKNFPAKYYYGEIFRTIYMIMRYYNRFATWRQFRQAVSDLKCAKMGINERYLP